MPSDIEVMYMQLLDFFPQVDPRVLKAVAIENRTNVNAAFCVVMDEVLPYINEITSLNEDLTSQHAASAEGSVDGQLQVVQEADATPSSESELATIHDGSSVSPTSDLGADKFLDEVSKIDNTDKLLSVCKDLAQHLNIMPEQFSAITSVHEDLEGKDASGDPCRGESYSSPMATEELAPLPTIDSVSSFVLQEVGESNANIAPSKGKGSEEALDCNCSCEPDIDYCMAISGDEQTKLTGLSDSGLQQDESVTDWFDANVSANGLGSLPSQAKKIELLESCIEEAKNNKKTLFLSMEAVMNIMREVEAREKAADEAKEDASKGGVEILSRAEELKTMLRKAKEANGMQAGEIYGEKSILVTEAKELQARLANLTKERDEALCILDEMHFTLEMRLAAADEEIRKAEEEKLDKEKCAKILLDEQEAIMNNIVQEAKILQLEAEENSKLREFLVDRGRTVDALHGEISVICQDVKSLKSKFDMRVPLSESVSSAETTCILASSSSSSKRSISSLIVSNQEAPFESISPSKSVTEHEGDGDGWEFVA
ncbi:hypothetical protein QQ045_024955 [Rhodiola kirilowii]